LKSETLAADVRRIKFDLIFVLMTFDEQNWGSSRKLLTLLAVVNVFFSHTVRQDAIEKYQHMRRFPLTEVVTRTNSDKYAVLLPEDTNAPFTQK
jgi:hypothetical protein